MGFGTLFVGYFLLLNVTNYAYTDLVSALIMAVGLIKLSTVNSHFKNASVTALLFAAIGLIEFVCELLRLIDPATAFTVSFMPIIRSAVICVCTLLILFGIRDVASEVDLPSLATRAKRMIPTAPAVYVATIILDTPILFSGVEPIIAAVLFAIVLVATLFLIIYNLITVYSAYMKICMPSDNVPKEKRSRFGVVNKVRDYEQKKAIEYTEYKLEKIKSKDKKK